MLYLNAALGPSPSPPPSVRTSAHFHLRQDDRADIGGDDVDRAYWEAQVGKDIMAVCDQVLEMVNDGSSRNWRPNYKKKHIGITDGATRRNFVHLGPRKSFVHIRALVGNGQEWLEELEEAGIDATPRKRGGIQITARPSEFPNHADTVRKIVQQATSEFES
jgi:hypothetical protein